MTPGEKAKETIAQAGIHVREIGVPFEWQGRMLVAVPRTSCRRCIFDIDIHTCVRHACNQGKGPDQMYRTVEDAVADALTRIEP